MRCTSVVWSAMSALSPAGAAQSAGGAGEGARFAQSPQYPLLPRALEIELALSAAPKHLRDDATVWAIDKRIRNREERQQESRKRCHAMFRDARSIVEQCLAGHSAPERVAFYIDTILFDLADITMNAIAAKPKDREAIRQAGFDLFWKGSAA